ncbi:MAG: hypothetical protein ACKOE7_14810 [Actinomycetota bacterium]
MPWCEPCSRYFAPSALTPGGQCPVCGDDIDRGRLATSSDAPTLRELSKMSGDKAPWHFKLLMVLLIAYLGWRIVAVFVD